MDRAGIKSLLTAFAVLFVIIFSSNNSFAATTYYKVKKGDNIHNIAKKFKTTSAKIMEANNMDSDRLAIGRKLVIPSDKKSKEATTKNGKKTKTQSIAADENVYKVSKGDTLSSIAKKFNTSGAKIKEVNDLDSNRLKIGQKLLIPPKNDKVKTLAKDKTDNSGEMTDNNTRAESNENKKIIYTVKKRDNLAKIAKKLGVSAASIREANNLDSDRLKIGQKLEIPTGKNDKKDYAAKREKTITEQESRESNEDSGKKTAPQVSVSSAEIKDNSAADKAEAEQKQTAHTETKEKTAYVDSERVKKADSADFQAQKENSSISTDHLKTGPVYKYHRLQKGETLASVAKKYGLSVRELKAINDIKKKKKARVGQNLIVGNVEGAKSRKIQRVDISQKIEQVKELSKAPELAEMSTTERLLLFAKKLLDIPYKFGGNGSIGVDCSSFVQKVYSFIGLNLPRSAREQFNVGQKISKDELKSGDLIFFRTYARFPSHVGIYIGDNLFIHASSISKKVQIDSLDKPYYVKRFIGAKRLLAETADTVEDAAVSIVTEAVKRHTLQAQ